MFQQRNYAYHTFWTTTVCFFFLRLPTTEKCLRRAGLDSTVVPQSTKLNKKHKSSF
jgi:hypothetical protein